MKKLSSESGGKKLSNQQKSPHARAPEASVYPFSAIVAQDEMKLAMILNVIDSRVGGVLIMGHRGTGKSTAVRALADLLPEISTVSGCAYHCEPGHQQNCCDECRGAMDAGATVRREKSAVRVVELPLGATEDRVCGTIDIEQALRSGVKRFEPGLLARANRGFLYIDEVNLLEDHLVDLLLDVSTTGINNVEREGISVRHPARFVLIGSGNPEEGELRPQLLDRFGLYVEVKTEDDPDRRVEIVERREAFERKTATFLLRVADAQDQLRRRLTRARKSLPGVEIERQILKDIARLCTDLKIDGHRGELTITRAVRALAAFEGRRKVNQTDVRRVAVMALRHRLRRDALEETASAERIEQAMNRILGADSAAVSPSDSENGDGPSTNDGQAITEHRTSRSSRGKGLSENRNGTDNVDQSLTASDSAGAPREQFTKPKFPKRGPGSSGEKKFKLSLNALQTRATSKSSSMHSGRQPGTDRSVYNRERGRYARSVNSGGSSGKIALDATLRAAASATNPRAPSAGIPKSAPDTRHPIPADALRFKLFKRKQGRLFIFAIDLSGSMALNRIHHAREAIVGLLRQSYVHRDSVAIIGFRGTAAQTMLPPSKSILRARRVLDSLPMGGGTPLSAGLASSLELAKRVGPTLGEVVLLVFTDGGANVTLQAKATDRVSRQQTISSEIGRLGLELKRNGVASVIVDTKQDFRSGDTEQIAATLGARLIKL